MRYGAPWSRLLIGVSIFATVICLGTAAIVGLGVSRDSDAPAWVAALPVLLVLVCALFIVRGYSIERDSILIHRPLWTTRLSRSGLRSATHEPASIVGGIRLFGNGGFFSFTGWFRNRELGTYRAYITDHSRAVVLRYGDRVVVVSPSDPARFADECMAR